MRTRIRRLAMVSLMLISMGFLVGDDCEFEMEDFHWPHWGHDDVIVYDPGYYVVPVYPEPVYFW